MAVSRGPVGPDRQQLLVGGRRVLVFPAIAEHPGAQIGDFFFFGLQVEGAAGAFERDFAASFMEQHLAQLTIYPGSLVIGNIGASEMNKACLVVSRGSRVHHALMNFTGVAQLEALPGQWQAEFHRARAGDSLLRDRRAG